MFARSFAVLCAFTLLLHAEEAGARGPDVVVTAGGGYGGVGRPTACSVDQSSCDDKRGWPAALLGLGIFQVSDSGVRGSLRLEGVMAFGQGAGAYADVLGVIGWQGERLVLEGGMGSALLWSRREQGPAHQLGGMFHAGLGLRVLPALAVLARADTLQADSLSGTFLGLTLEYLPLRRPSVNFAGGEPP
jgi:hypothetical protein